jgi:outer membrane protein insertion porin family
VADLDAAVQKLGSTGLFTASIYKYGPSATGTVVTLTVTEANATAKVVLDIPGLDESAFWSAMAGTLIDKVLPQNPDAAAYYAKSIAAWLSHINRPEQILEEDEADLNSHSMTAVFQPANRPLVAQLRFAGNQAIPAKTLQDLTARLIVDNPYSERQDHAILDANLRPVYEEKGYLKVAFPAIGAEKTADGKMILTAAVEEGRVWNLGIVTPSGEGVDGAAALKAADLKAGIANWKAVSEGMARMLTELQRTGYIQVRVSTARTFRDDSGTVDVGVDIKRGKMFRFGQLELTGLNDADKHKAEGLWKLQPGAPMDSPYVNEYLKAVFQEVKPTAKSVSQQLKTSEDSVTVALTFSGGK